MMRRLLLSLLLCLPLIAGAQVTTNPVVTGATIVPQYGTWTPSDASGATLTFTSPTGWWIKINTLVCVGFDLTYPITANGSSAKIGGLPFTAATTATPGALAVAFTNMATIVPFLLVSSGTTQITIYKNAGNVINSDLGTSTGKEIQGGGCYQSAS